MVAQPNAPAAALSTVIHRVNDVLATFLDVRRHEIERIDPPAALMIEEVRRLVDAGGKRLRPLFCYWGYRAAGADDGEPIVRAAAAIELLHTMALVHDDLMDGARERRGAPTTVARLAALARTRDLGRGDPDAFGAAGAVLVGDLAAVLADRLLLEAGFSAEALVRALAPYHVMRIEMAVGQFLDVAGARVDPPAARHVARLKGGSYTVEGPLQVGAALAGATPLVEAHLRRFGAPLGEAFQLRDDLLDGDGRHGATAADVNALVDGAVDALDPDVLDPGAVSALCAVAGTIVVR